LAWTTLNKSALWIARSSSRYSWGVVFPVIRLGRELVQVLWPIVVLDFIDVVDHFAALNRIIRVRCIPYMVRTQSLFSKVNVPERVLPSSLEPFIRRADATLLGSNLWRHAPRRFIRTCTRTMFRRISRLSPSSCEYGSADIARLCSFQAFIMAWSKP